MAEATVSESATISTSDAPRVIWDVVIVGAGPAGAVAARDVARRGLRALLIDRANFPRRKVCGSCLNRHALSALTATGLGDLPHRLGAVPIDSMTLANDGRSATFAMAGGVSLSREAFDLALVQAAKNAGAEFLPGTPIRLDGREDEFWRLHGDGQTFLAKVLIDASGLNVKVNTTSHNGLALRKVGSSPPASRSKSVSETSSDITSPSSGRLR